MNQNHISISLSELAEKIGARLIGDGKIEISRLVHPAEAEKESDLALATERRFLELLTETTAIAAVVASAQSAVGPQRGYLVVERSRYAMAKLIDIFSSAPHFFTGIHPNAFVDETAEISDKASIGPMTCIGPGVRVGANTVILDNVTLSADASIGESCLVYSGVRIGERVKIGDGVICQPNSVIGSDGFSYVTPNPGSVESAKASGQVNSINSQIVRIHSLGTVIVEDNVEIGANVTIDRGTISATRIGKNSKLDNQVHIAHNVVVGENCMICGQVGVAGSSIIGDRVVLAGQAGVSDHVTIGSDSVVAGKSGVGRSLKPRSVVAGYPARDKAAAFQEIATIRRLGSFMEDLKAVKNRLSTLENNKNKD